MATNAPNSQTRSLPAWVRIGNRLVDSMTDGPLAMLDWLFAFAVFGYGVYHQDYVWMGAGLAGFVIAWMQPAKRIRDLARRKAVTRR